MPTTTVTYELGEIVEPRVRVNIPGLKLLQDLGDYILYQATYDCAIQYYAVDRFTKELYHVNTSE
jgi:hypothetical protein